jgi:multiple sugar transport system substrate-binding protein
MKKTLITSMLCMLSAVAAPAKTTLTWLDYQTTQTKLNQLLEEDFKQYSAEHPDIEIKRTVVPFGELKNRIIQGAATKTVPDIVMVDNPDHQAMADQGAFADITDYIKDWKYKDKYFKGPWASTIYKGRNYGIPCFSNATVLWVNQDLLKKAGISQAPATWDELRADAKKLTGGGVYGLSLSGVGTEEGTFTFLPFLWSAGSDIATIGDEGSIKAFAMLRDLVVTDKSVSRAAIGWTQPDAFNVWVAGRSAMMINGPWQLPAMEAAKVKYPWTIAPWPKDKVEVSILGGENFALGNGKNVEEAWKFLQWLTEPERIKAIVLSTGNITNREDLADDPAWAGDPIKRVFLHAVRIAKPRAYGPKYPKMSEVIFKAMQAVMTGAKAPEQAAKDAQAELKPLLAE